MALQFWTQDVRKHPDFDLHETVLGADDDSTGFRAYIALHNTTLGPARGGCRYWPSYANDFAAIGDVLKLSRGMTYKCALAGLPHGGGKTVIMGKPGTSKPSPETMLALGHMLNELNGIYETGEDVGTSVEDFKVAGKVTDHVRVKAIEKAGAIDLPNGPPYYTAQGVYFGIKAAVKHRLKQSDLKGVRVAVKGLGHVAMPLCGLLHNEGAILTVADIDPAKVKRAEELYGAKAVSPDDILSQEADVYSPCALGGDLSDENIPKLKATIVAGAANNQLADIHQAQTLHRAGILYAPDYCINAGGVINVVLVGHTHEQVMARTAGIGDTLATIFRISETHDTNTALVAEAMVRERLAESKLPEKKALRA
ncbi:MAG TPA: amino acid dehydrogenase [Alphaproteobacteria bacterium]|nr:amino acid dehydrogenase [Alphaproteobacteria bacterium]